MTVFQHHRTKNWNYNFTLDGNRYSRECRDANGLPVTNRRAALACEAEARRIASIAPKLARADELTLVQVIDGLSVSWAGTKDADNKDRYARTLMEFFKPRTPVREMTSPERIQAYIKHVQTMPVLVWTGGTGMRRDTKEAEKFWKKVKGKRRGAATVNRYLPMLRGVFKSAFKTRDPVSQERAIPEVPEVIDLPEPKRKARPVPPEVLTDILNEVQPHIADAIRLTLYFGFRKGEVFTLRINQVDQDRGGIKLRAEDVKDKEDAFLPGSEEAMALLAKLVTQARKRGTFHLITYRQCEAHSWRPIKSPKRSWSTVMRMVEERHGARWRWHDIRAAYISRIANTVGVLAAKALARHSDLETTMAYVEIDAEAKRAGAEAVSSWVSKKVSAAGGSK